MGSIISKKVEEEKNMTPARECIFKRIEDPRSPTEEISRTPIEVAAKLESSNDAYLYPRAQVLRQQHANFPEDFSPRIKKSVGIEKKDPKQLICALSTDTENEPILSVDDTTNMQYGENENMAGK